MSGKTPWKTYGTVVATGGRLDNNNNNNNTQTAHVKRVRNSRIGRGVTVAGKLFVRLYPAERGLKSFGETATPVVDDVVDRSSASSSGQSLDESVCLRTNKINEKKKERKKFVTDQYSNENII